MNGFLVPTKRPEQVQKLVLFDIDGTLLCGGSHWSASFLAAVREIYPGAEIPKISFAGKTDRWICQQILDGLSVPTIEWESATDRILELYLRNLSQLTHQEHFHTGAEVLPGVFPLLDALSARPEVCVGVLTGNVEKGAYLKLSGARIDHHFEFGVFGCDHWDRNRLPSIAIDRFASTRKRQLAGPDLVVIGDTVFDIRCGKTVGARTIAVGTGKTVEQASLHREQPDFYFKDLSQTDRVVHAIVGGL